VKVTATTRSSVARPLRSSATSRATSAGLRRCRQRLRRRASRQADSRMRRRATASGRTARSSQLPARVSAPARRSACARTHLLVGTAHDAVVAAVARALPAPRAGTARRAHSRALLGDDARGAGGLASAGNSAPRSRRRGQ
jgi:hypothetical protein